MPVHDWSKISANLYHHFHQAWALRISDALNELLPPDYSALVEQHAPEFIPDVLAVERIGRPIRPRPVGGGTTTLAKPATRFTETKQEKSLAARASRVAIRHDLGDIVCIVEIVSPGNKRSRKALNDFVTKTQEFIAAGVHVLLIDILPPNRLAPSGLHPLIWEDVHDSATDPTPEEPLTLTAYRAEEPYADTLTEAFLERLAVGAKLADMPAYIEWDEFIPVPLEETYMKAWQSCPAVLRNLVEQGTLPGS